MKPLENSVALPSGSVKLQPHQDELYQLGQLAGIHMDSNVFRILMELLNMGVDANTIFSVLKSIKRSIVKHNRGFMSQSAHS